MRDFAFAQSIQVTPNRLLTAMPDGRSWLVEFGSSRLIALPRSDIAARKSSIATSFVEAAISAGLTQTGYAPSAGVRTSLLGYIRWLAGNYIFATQTPGIVGRAADRFEELGRSDLAEFSRQKGAEEDGHAELAFRDLQALGLPAIETIRAVQAPSTTVFIDRLRNYAESSTPITLFGFSYCLERVAVGRDDAFIRTIEAICPPGCRAFRFLKVHSGIGSDHDHVDDQLAFFDSLSVSDLALVVCAAYETATLLARQSQMDQALTDEEVGRRLEAAGVRSLLHESVRKVDPSI